MNQSSPVRVRFAPSPTGQLHIGGLRTALFNWLFARHHKGTFLLRIEDTDTERSKQEYTDAILGAFEWVDMLPDEPIVIQSQRLPEHKAIIQKLIDNQHAYRCYCTPEQVTARHEQAYPGDAFVKYDGLCRAKTQNTVIPDTPFVVRFALPTDRPEISFNDLIRGHVTFPINQLDDFIIARSDGQPMYNFVVVIDDAFMRVSHIIRAQEHLVNTPKQILLYEACDYPMPQFAHVSLILGPSGDKLSKRDGATSVLDYKKEGYLPDALLNYLARLGWAHGDQEIFSIDELISYFSLDHIAKKGAIFDVAKLLWVNATYMRRLSAQELYTYALDSLEQELVTTLTKCYATTPDLVLTAITLYKERTHTVKELMIAVLTLCEGPTLFNAQDLSDWITPQTEAYLEEIAARYHASNLFELNLVKSIVQDVARNNDVKLVQIAQPLRIALQGNSSGPGVFELIMALGKDESLKRIQKLNRYIHK